MLCGVPCAVTDCGDSRVIVGPHGRTVRPRDPDALAGAILELLALPPAARTSLGEAGRESVRARYDICDVARRYLALYGEVVAESGNT
jgi:glycosyltransferase involved in cell wall biosynthesis